MKKSKSKNRRVGGAPIGAVRRRQHGRYTVPLTRTRIRLLVLLDEAGELVDVIPVDATAA